MIVSTPIRATLVDDYAVVAPGVRHLLQPYSDRIVLVDLADALADPRSVDVVLYEPVGLRESDHESLQRLVHVGGARAVVFTWRDQAQHLAGAASPGRLSKALPAADLVTGLERIHRQQPGRPGQAGAAGQHRPVDRTPHGALSGNSATAALSLTPREAEILALIVQGYTNVEIGKKLYLSINSVKTYVRGAYRKIDVTRRPQAVAWGMQNGLGGVSTSPDHVA
ncbi:response regulator transcription factor [Nocardioides sp. P86]|uniref:helix-turn-helix transcriptional regulator n=1 Tax=Nocardioides sp. P86 TaxID=2939569 RepID=UPI00203C9754|nr:response regulator transcription factor [Nocardioides sp. P86]MCM3516926.1 response regulator transcription factor [Nocardioides sp. P86]